MDKYLYPDLINIIDEYTGVNLLIILNHLFKEIIIYFLYE